MKKKSDISVIDFHSHILPSADHGSDGIETSLLQLKLMEKYGTDIAVATPHFYPHKDTVEDFLQRRQKAAELLAESKNSRVKIAIGAEVYAVAGIEELDGLEKLTIKGTNTLLLEMPFSYWNTNIVDTVMKLDSRFDLVLAHIDRYPTKAINNFIDMGIKAQINAGNSIKFKNRERLHKWLCEDAVWAIGSDFHMAKAKDYRVFKKAQKLLKHDIEKVFSHSMELINSAELF